MNDRKTDIFGERRQAEMTGREKQRVRGRKDRGQRRANGEKKRGKKCEANGE